MHALGEAGSPEADSKVRIVLSVPDGSPRVTISSRLSRDVEALLAALTDRVPVRAIEATHDELSVTWLPAISERDALSLALVTSSVDVREALLVGRFLHDLKNHLGAFRAASAKRAGDRTGDLEARLAASRHLDAARQTLARLAAIGGALEEAPDEPIDLAPLLDQYVGQLVIRRPQNVRVEVGAFLFCPSSPPVRAY